MAVGIGDEREGGRSILVGGAAPICVTVALGEARRSMNEWTRLAVELRSAGAAVLFAGRVSANGHRDALGLDDLQALRDVTGERISRSLQISDLRQIDDVAPLADVLQIGSASMQDFNLLRELGRCDRPVLLRRGSGSIVEEFPLAAEYVLTYGNGRVILCESGIRTFDAGSLLGSRSTCR